MPRLPSKKKAISNANNDCKGSINSKTTEGEVAQRNVSNDPNGGTGIYLQEKQQYGNDKYKPEFCQVIIELGKLGKTASHFAVGCGVGSKKTIYNWRDRYPDFGEAFEMAMTYSFIHWYDCAQDCANNPPSMKNFNAVKYIMAACFGLVEKTGVDVTSNGNTVNSELTSLISELRSRKSIEQAKSEIEEFENKTRDDEYDIRNSTTSNTTHYSTKQN